MRSIPIYKLKILNRTLLCLFALFFSGIHKVNAETEKANFDYDALPFTLSNIKEHIIPIDMDGDGLKDLLCSNDSSINIYFQQKDAIGTDAFSFIKPDISIDLPGDAVGWDVDYPAAEQSDNTSGKRLLAIVDGKSVMTWSVKNRSLSRPAVLIEGLPGFLPKGGYPLRFIRDVNSDGRTDIILPGNGKLHIYLQDDKGEYKGNIFINTRMGMNSLLKTPEDIARKVGQSVTIPAMTIRDVNNDKLNDVISTVDKITEVFLGKPDGTFPGEPSFRIDLDKMTSPPKEFDWDTFDFSNIFSAISTGPQQILQDLDGDRIEDLLLLDNGKITVYKGTPHGIDLEKPGQILKSSGNVLAALLAVTREKDKNRSPKDAISAFISENKDETRPKDLILIRLQDLSVGDIFTWLVLSKDIDIDFFVYKNQGKEFEKRPGRKITLTLKMPSALKILNYINDLRDSEQNPANIMVISADLSKTSAGKDRLVLKDNTIQGFQMKDNIPVDRLDETRFNEIIDLFNRLGFTVKEDHYIMDVDKMMKNLPELGNFELLELKDEQPEFTLDITKYLTNTIKGKSSDKQSISSADLNNDNRDDIFLFTDRDDKSVAGTLFMSR